MNTNEIYKYDIPKWKYRTKLTLTYISNFSKIKF